MSNRLINLEKGIEALCNSDQASQKEALRHLQEIDILVQSSETLASYAKALSEKVAGGAMIDASELLRAVPLRDVAARLGGQPAETSNGEFQLL